MFYYISCISFIISKNKKYVYKFPSTVPCLMVNRLYLLSCYDSIQIIVVFIRIIIYFYNKMTLTTKILLCLLLLKYYCVYYYLNIIVFTVIKILLCLLLIKYLCVYCYYNYFAMPRPRRSNISKRSRNAMRHRNNETQYTADEREIARELRRVSMGRTTDM